MARLTWLSSMLAVCFLGLQFAEQKSRAADAAGVPRYSLKVGQQINYKGTSDSKYSEGKGSFSFGYNTDWTVWVVKTNDDGSHRIVIRALQKMRRDGKSVGGGRSTFVYCDVYPDGRITSNPSVGYALDPSSLFPQLPENAAQEKSGWEALRDRDEGRSTFKTVGKPKADAFAFEEVRKSLMDEIYLGTHDSKITFDKKRGLVSQVKSENAQGYGNGKGTSTLELVSVKPSPEPVAQLWEQADRYFQATHLYEEKTEQAAKNTKSSKKLVDEAKTLLTDAESKVTLPMFKDQLKQQVKEHDQMARYIAEEAARRAKIVGHPAAEWQAPDLAGKTHSLKDYRGKVVILDFWYRGCGWCMRAMPQMKQLSAEFRGQPVVVLGMNTDRKEEDAKFVVKKMGLDYSTLKIEKELPGKYGVQGFPTLIIIDQRGNVHDMHVGYSPTLQREVGETVRQLLAKG